jgi:hypothetical protein
MLQRVLYLYVVTYFRPCVRTDEPEVACIVNDPQLYLGKDSLIRYNSPGAAGCSLVKLN